MRKVKASDIDQNLEELKKGFEHALMYKSESYRVNKDGSIKFLTETELMEELYGKNSNT